MSTPFRLPLGGDEGGVEGGAGGAAACGCRFVAVNVEKHDDVRTLFDVTTVPTYLFVRNGETVHRHDGAMVPSTIAARLDDL